MKEKLKEIELFLEENEAEDNDSYTKEGFNVVCPFCFEEEEISGETPLYKNVGHKCSSCDNHYVVYLEVNTTVSDPVGSLESMNWMFERLSDKDKEEYLNGMIDVMNIAKKNIK